MIEEVFSSSWYEAKTFLEKREVIKNKIGFIPSIVYLDDEIELLSIFEKNIQSLGLDCHVSSDPNEALMFLTQFSDKVLSIFSDYKMPKMNGFEFRKETLKISNFNNFFILSSYIDSETVLRSYGLNISAFFDKPYTNEKFLSYIKRKNIDSSVLMEAESFLEKNEQFDVFWKNIFEKYSIQVFIISSGFSSPLKCELIDIENNILSIQCDHEINDGLDDFFIKMTLVYEDQNSKFLIPVKKILINEKIHKENKDSYLLEIEVEELKKEDNDLLKKVISERQKVSSDYLVSVQKLKNTN